MTKPPIIFSPRWWRLVRLVVREKRLQQRLKEIDKERQAWRERKR